MDRGILSGRPTIGSVGLKTTTLLDIAHRRKLKSVTEIMALPEARLLNPEEKEIISARLEDELPAERRRWAAQQSAKDTEDVLADAYAAILMIAATAKHIDKPDEIMKLPSARYIPPGLTWKVRSKVVHELNNKAIQQ
jgi:hypothetical protein